jgi:DNA-binding transcriptional ArsR family regulator
MDREEFDRRAKALADKRGFVTAASLAEALDLPESESKERLKALYDGGALELDLDGEDFVYRLKGQVKGTDAKPVVAKAVAAKAAKRQEVGEPTAPTPNKPTGIRVRELPDEDDGDSKEQAPESDDGPGIADQLQEATQALVTQGRTAVKDAAFGALVDEPGAKEVADEDRKKLLYGIGLGAIFPGIGLFYSAPMLSAGLATAFVLLVLGILQVIPVLGTILSLYVFGAFMLASGLLGGLYTHRFNKTGRRTRLLKSGEGRRALPF